MQTSPSAVSDLIALVKTIGEEKRAQGFVPFARGVETFADPRLLGVLPEDAAPQIPLLRAPSRR